MELDKTLIGMIHVQALPGTPQNKYLFNDILEQALREAEIYTDNGITTVLLENMFDIPYLKKDVGPEIVSSMAVLAYELKKRFDINLGIQILAGCNKAALACALTSGADFIRSEGFVFAHVADEGLMDGDAGQLLRYRKQIGAENVKIFTDIKKKHSSHSITADVSIVETAKAAQFFASDGVVVTGKATGETVNLDELQAVKNSVGIPVLVGSGITPENIPLYYKYADGFIVGSYFKRNGYWRNELSSERIKELVQMFA